ncbi:50S ribosomal protein L11 [bacterium HR35]|nr:50S ribosomal protein L11 [bacterium HR35]
MAGKKVKAKLKLIIEGGKATPAPPLGPTLAPHGINIAQFCNEFNQKTKDLEGIEVPVYLTIYEDKSFEMKIGTPPISTLIKLALKLERGSHEPGREIVGKLSKKQVREIAEKKLSELNTDNLEKAMKIVEGVARSMGVVIVDEER